jgi:hypothetical protein
MAIATPHHWPRLLIGTFLALSIQACCASSARAGCGDYLTQHGATTPFPVPAPSKLPAAPCHGPWCSNHSAPLLPAPSVSPPSGPQEGLLASFLVRNPGLIRRALLADPLLLLPDLVSNVFHPPRLA